MTPPTSRERPVYRGHHPRRDLIPITAGRVDRTKSFDDVRARSGAAPVPPVEANARTPYLGVTADGVVRPGLYRLADEDLDPAPLVDAARSFLASLPMPERERSVLPLDAPEWRLWTNAFPSWEPHGVLLEELDEPARSAATALLAASLSPSGYRDVREAMALNGELGELIGRYRDSLTEWMYWLAIFGTPSVEAPWGWQLSGHHVDLNCLVVGRQMVCTPTFLGAEHDADRVFADERRLALGFVNGLPRATRDAAILYPSMEPGVLPTALAGPVDGRHLGGAGQDNRIVPYEGLCATGLSPGQREALLALAGVFTDRLPDGPARHRRAAIEAHLDETYVAWIGGTGDEDAFYVRIHSPVVLAEYDNHPGVFLDFDEPEPFHVHTVIRTPNGNDYGKDLLRSHYAAHHGQGSR